MTVVNPKSISGINSITTGSGSDNLLTIHTSDASSTERVRINSDGDVIVGSGITVSPDGDIFSTGITTVRYTGTSEYGLDVHNPTSGGSGARIRAGDSDSQYALLVENGAGTNLFEVLAGGGGARLRSGDLSILDKIAHYGDGNTFIRFPAADTITAETGGSERVRIDSSGRLLIGSTAKAGDSALQVYTSDQLHPAIRVHSPNANAFTLLADAYAADESNVNFGVSYSSASLVISQGCKVSTSSDDAYVSSQDSYSTKPNVFRLDTDGSFSFFNTNTSATTTTDSAVSLTERFTIKSDGTSYVLGDFGVGTNSPQSAGLTVENSSEARLRVRAGSSASNGEVALRADGSNTQIGTWTDHNLKLVRNTTEVASLTTNGISFPSGKGVDFSATGDGSGASGVSELLDDYEEGTFTVTLANSLTVGQQTTLSYTKIGNKVHISGQFKVTSGGSDLIVSNLPFTTKNTGSTDETFSTGICGLYNVTFPTDGSASGEIVTKTQKNDTNLYFVYNRTGNDPNQHTATTNGYYTVSHWYTAA